jgi:prephenate dehydrogenase
LPSPTTPICDCLAIIGVGLIGGSIGLAAKERGLVRQVVGVGRRIESLKIARKRGAIDRFTTELSDGIEDADLAIVCTPVEAIPGFVREIARRRGGDILITDAGSTKVGVVRAIDDQIAQSRSEAPNSGPIRFVGGHPLAGDHNSGPAHARADLFDGRLVIVTPTRRTRASDVAAIREFWSRLGATVQKMSAARHDRLLSAASHAPHLAAAALAAATDKAALAVAGAGWKDATRIAAGDPGLWRQIALANRENIVRDLRRIEIELESLRTALEQDDGRRLETVLRKAKRNRDAVGS